MNVAEPRAPLNLLPIPSEGQDHIPLIARLCAWRGSAAAPRNQSGRSGGKEVMADSLFECVQIIYQEKVEIVKSCV